MARRVILDPKAATNEGSRRIRTLARKQPWSAIARKLGCDERAVRSWAHEENKPSLVVRSRMTERLGTWEPSPWADWPEEIWDAPPASDVYASESPTTTRRAAPATTKPRPS